MKKKNICKTKKKIFPRFMEIIFQRNDFMHWRKYLSLATTLSVNCLSSTSRSWGQVYDLTAGIANKCISVTSNGSSFLNTSFWRRHFLVLRKLRQSRIFAKYMRKETIFRTWCNYILSCNRERRFETRVKRTNSIDSTSEKFL